MSSSARVQDLLPPEQGGGESGAVGASRDWGAEVLALLRERRAQPGFAAQESLPPEVEDALFAWAVTCYEARDFDDAGVLLDELSNREAPSLRVLRAKAVNLMAMGRYEDSAAAFQQASRLAGDDAELLFFRAQVLFLLRDNRNAQDLLRQSMDASESAPSDRPPS